MLLSQEASLEVFNSTAAVSFACLRRRHCMAAQLSRFLKGLLFTSRDAHATAQEQSSRPKGKQASDKQGRSLELVWSSTDELPCLPEFELWLQKEPGKGERPEANQLTLSKPSAPMSTPLE